MDSPLVNNLLWLVPLIVWFLSKKMAPINRSILRGVSFGAVIAPASTGLYGFYFLGQFAAILGIFGLVLSVFHSSPGYEIATLTGLIQEHTITKSSGATIIHIINGIFWAIIYGALAYAGQYFVGKK